MTAAEIQKLIDAPRKPDGTIEVTIPAGEHTLDKELRLKPGVRLRGVADQTVLRADDPENNILRLIPGNDPVPHDVQISDVHLLGPRTSDDITDKVASSKEKGCGILVFAKGKIEKDDALVVENIIIERCRIENVSGCGIRFDTREDVLMRDIEVRDCHVIQSGRPTEDKQPANYKDITFYGTRFENITIERNTCVFTPTGTSRYGNDAGIAFVGNGRVVGVVGKTRILNNTCNGHRRHGLITNYGKMVTDDVTVRGNTCRDNRWTGIYVNTSNGINKGNLVIENNTCENNGYGGLPQLESKTPEQLKSGDGSIRGGIVLNNCFNSRIAGNTCNNNGTPSADFKPEDADVTQDLAAGIRVRGSKLVLDANVMKGNVRGDEVENWQWPKSFEAAEITIKKASASIL